MPVHRRLGPAGRCAGEELPHGGYGCGAGCRPGRREAIAVWERANVKSKSEVVHKWRNMEEYIFVETIGSLELTVLLRLFRGYVCKYLTLCKYTR